MVWCAALFFSQITIVNATDKEDKAPLSDNRKVELVHMVKQDCGSCHGMTLKGGLGPALLPENLKEKSVLFIQNTIFYGRPDTAMPPWQPILSQQEIIWISQQLKQGAFTQ
jgi:cytochrome c55X